MIPLLATAIVNRPDLLQRLISSIDYPVGEVLVIDNGRDNRGYIETPECVGKMTTIYNGSNMGCAGAWNQSINHAFNERRYESVLIVGNDIEWAPGDLGRIATTVEQFPDADFVFGNHSFSNFMVLRSGWEKCGWFWEELYPAYWEDSEMWQRIIRTNAKAIHAAGLHAKHEGSATINSDPVLKRQNDRTFKRNAKLYADRWGYINGRETFSTPYNKGGDVRDWELSEERKALPFFRSHG